MITRQWPGRIITTAVLFSLLVLSLGLATQSVLNAHAAGTTNPNYQSEAATDAQVLQSWYNTSNGVFNTTGWWNSANALNALIDYSRLTGNTAYTSDIATTYNLNSSGGFVSSAHSYDDEGWWALTWLNAYDYTGNVTYLNMAKSIFTDITGAWDSTCNGGVWWSGARTYKNAITNELFLELAARLHERTPGDGGSGSYLDWANREWTWFSASGMINSSNLINDGLNSSCQNNGQTTWTYNQGVILGGLTDMYKITANTSYLTEAETIANAATTSLVNTNGSLKEPNEPCGSSCGPDGPQFKGIFMRNLAYLYAADHQQAYENFILTNANSIWQNDRNSANQFGMEWAGPVDSVDAARQSSTLDAFNAAIQFSNASSSTNLSNVALNKTATGDSSCTSAETPNKAVDGSTTNDSKWCSGGTNGQYWLQVDLGASYTIASFTVMHAGAGGEESDWNTQAFTIQTSSDAANWATPVNVQNNTASVTTHTIAPTTARYMKLVITVPQSSTQYVAARIYEFQAYAFPATVATPTPTPTASSCTGTFNQGVNSTSSTQAQFWFQPCGWTAGYVILHYVVPGQSQQNVYTTYNSSNGQWQYTAGGMSSGQTITYSFTYQQNSLQYDTSSYSWVHP